MKHDLDVYDQCLFLCQAFEEPEFNSEEGQEQNQRLVDLLLRVMVDSIGFSVSELSSYFTAKHSPSHHLADQITAAPCFLMAILLDF